MSGGGANTHLRAITSDQLIVGQHVRGSCWNLAIAITMMNQLYFSYELRLKGALEGRRGCPEFCVNGASVNSSASFPQIEW